MTAVVMVIVPSSYFPHFLPEPHLKLYVELKIDGLNNERVIELTLFKEQNWSSNNFCTELRARLHCVKWMENWWVEEALLFEVGYKETSFKKERREMFKRRIPNHNSNQVFTKKINRKDGRRKEWNRNWWEVNKLRLSTWAATTTTDTTSPKTWFIFLLKFADAVDGNLLTKDILPTHSHSPSLIKSSEGSAQN